MTVQSLTSFIVFEVVAGKGAKSACTRFTLNLPLEGAPGDRVERVLQAVLGDQQRFLRYLLLLLADHEDVAAIGASLIAAGDGGVGDRTHGVSLPLFEELLKALARSPAKLIAIARLVDDLKRTPAGRSLFPEGFDEMWGAIWIARATLAKDKHG